MQPVSSLEIPKLISEDTMINRRMWVIRALWVLWLFTLPAQASNLGDLVKNGDVAAVVSALDKGAAVDEIDGVTALYIACERGNVELARLLIKRGAGVNLPVSWQRTPLYAANKGGHADIVKPRARSLTGRPVRSGSPVRCRRFSKAIGQAISNLTRRRTSLKVSSSASRPISISG
ncbi:MAG: ankyrin repeat domain-containing protein [Mesorhizobium sp.]|nr:MAG: ankyrin repeat domain-containing protein [Mesorhizobium sp.]